MSKKKKFTEVQGYWRAKHFTHAHKRMLNDGNFLELAENGENRPLYLWPETLYILLPDPFNQVKPIYVRADKLINLSDSDFYKLLAYLNPFNDAETLQKFTDYRNNTFGLAEGEGDAGGTDWGEIAGLVDTVIGLFDSGNSGNGDGSGDPNPNNYSIVGLGGLVACRYTDPDSGNLVGMGLNPVKKQLIAFSSLSEVKKVFPNLPPTWSGNQYPPLPAQVPEILINLALKNPNKIIQYATPVNGNDPIITVNNVEVTGIDPTTGQPEIEITEEGSGVGKLVLAGLGLFAASKLF